MPEVYKKKNILVISDPLEVFRQPHADIENYISSIFSKLFDSESLYSSEFLHGNLAESVINNIDTTKYDLIIFASNAIIRRQSSIYTALVKNKDKLEKFILAGKSIVLFHQGFSGQKSEVDFLDFMSAKNWVAANLKDNRSVDFDVDEQHPILQFPNLITKQDFLNNTLQSPFYLCYYGVEVSNELLDSRVSRVVNVNNPNNCVALMTYENKGRVILSPYPADWMKDEALLENIFYYALNGVVDRVAILEENSEDYYNMLITRLGSHSNVIKFYDRDNVDNDFTFNYLSKNVDLFIFPNEELKEKYLKSSLMNEALIRGADIVVVNNLVVNGLSYENFNYLIGRNSYQSNIFIFNAIFSNMKRDCWFKNALTHDIRDVLMAAYDMSYEGGEYNLSKFNSIIGVVAPQVQARAIAWLENNNITKDPITAVIAFWLLKIAGQDTEQFKLFEKKFLKVYEEARYREIALTIETLLTNEKPKTIDVTEYISSNNCQFGSLIRFLDDFYMSRLLGRDLEFTIESYNHIYLKLSESINLRPNFFDQSEASTSMVATLVRFILDIPAHLPLKKRASVLLNTLVDFLNKKNQKREDELEETAILSVPLIITVATFNKVEKIFPINLYRHLALYEKNNYSQLNYDYNIKILNKSIVDRDQKLEKQEEEFDSFKKEATEKIDIMKLQSIVGVITVYLIFLILVMVDIFFLIKAIESLIDSRTDYVGFVVSLVPLTVAYTLFILKKKLHILRK